MSNNYPPQQRPVSPTNGQQYPMQYPPVQSPPPPGYFPPQPPQPKKSWFARHKIATGLLGVLVVGSLAKGMSGGSTSGTADAADPVTVSTATAKSTTGSTATTTKASPQATKATTSSLPKIGTVVHHNDYDFTIKSFKCGVHKLGDQYLNTTAQGQFCIVQISAKNTGDKEQTFAADEQKLLDKDGKEYSYSSEGTICGATSDAAKSIWLEPINPGNTVTGSLVYDVPKSVTPVKIHLTDGGFIDSGVDIALS